MNRGFRTASFYLLIIMVVLALIQYFSAQTSVIQEFKYTEFYALVEKGEVTRVNLVGNEIKGELKNGTRFRSYTPEDPRLIPLLQGKGVEVKVEPPPEPPWWMTMVTYLLMFLLFLGALFFLMQQTQAGGNRVMAFGRSRAKLYQEPKRKVTFADVAGYAEVKEELSEVVDFLKHPKKFIELGARIPKGVLLFGPPGTGKTLLARAIAGEAGVPFYSISGSDFVEMFVGVGAARVRDLFENAKKNAPCIVFIDEIDAVGRHRGAGLGGGHDEREQTLNELLVQMDGFDVNEGLIVIAGTNRPDILDPALLRPGRFDRHIVVDAPDIKDREAILGVHAQNKPMAQEVTLDVIARRTPGFTGADLENLINEGALLAARRGKRTIEMAELEEAINRVIAGPEKKSRLISDREKRLVAYHEGGHALVASLLPNTDPVHMVTIIPRGKAGGYTIMLPTEDRHYVTRSELLARVTVLLAGRVAEQLALGDISTGAQNDLEQATLIVRKMITEYGMSKALGPLTLGHKETQVFLGRDIARDRNYSEEIARSIDLETRKIVDTSYQQAEEIITQNRASLDALAEMLLEKETVKGEELAEMLAQMSHRDSAAGNPSPSGTDGEERTGSDQEDPSVAIHESGSSAGHGKPGVSGAVRKPKRAHGTPAPKGV
ncbi:MAG: ATP-dependent metallopeptidase FtsH/Yme1/Tma family protein [Firmicutes bacterium]|nr:ATP-dependent metallopeptidase FtsH/Yme1/Tma family protein [Bacillota bacterium]